MTVRSNYTIVFLFNVKNFVVKYLARFSHCQLSVSHGDVVRTKATKCIAHMSRPEGTKDRRGQKAGV